MTLKQRLQQQQARGRSIAQLICCHMTRHHCKTAEVSLKEGILKAVVYKNGEEFLLFTEKSVSQQVYQYVIKMISAVYEFKADENDNGICEVTRI